LCADTEEIESMPLELERDEVSGALVLRLDGELDVARAPSIRSALEPAIRQRCRNLILDLTDVTYADSSALGLLVWLADRLGRLRGKIILVGANRDVSRVIELSGLLTLSPAFSASPTVAAALEGLELTEVQESPEWHEAFSVDASVDNLAEARERVVGIIAELGLPRAALYDIKVGVGEALANAVLHGSPHGEQDSIVVDVAAYADRVTVAVTDSGEDPDSSFEGASGDYAPTGRGMIVMRAFLDRVDVSRSAEGRTTVTLAKHLRRA
jgi:stage II sporulation protein AA (anti-sigma F factor antagonist)